MLHHHRARRHLVTVANVSTLEIDGAEAAQLAVDSQVEERELSDTVLHLKAYTKRPDILELERCLLADDLAFVPWFAVLCVDVGFHDGLPSSQGNSTVR